MGWLQLEKHKCMLHQHTLWYLRSQRT